MKRIFTFGLILTAVLVACEADDNGDGGSESAGCREKYSVENGYGHENRWRDDAGADESGSYSGDQAQEECESQDGDACDASGFITTDAAICLAQVYGLDEGIGDFQAHLVYNYNYKTVIWAVDNLQYSDAGECGQGGENMYIHATTGELLGEGNWDQTC